MSISTVLFGSMFLLNKFFFPSYKLFGSVSPINLSLIAGAFIFGIGSFSLSFFKNQKPKNSNYSKNLIKTVQLADGCSSGVLYTLGKGSFYSVFILPFFFSGILLGVKALSYNDGSWNVQFWDAVNFLYILNFENFEQQEMLSKILHIGANICIVLGQSFLFLFLFGFLGIVEKFSRKFFIKQENEEESSCSGCKSDCKCANGKKCKFCPKCFLHCAKRFILKDILGLETENGEVIETLEDLVFALFVSVKRFFIGPWSFYYGAILLAFLAFGVWMMAQRPWGVVGGLNALTFQICANLLHFPDVKNPKTWSGYKQMTKQLDAEQGNFWKILATNQPFVTDIGMVLGAMIGTILSFQFPMSWAYLYFDYESTEKNKENMEKVQQFFNKDKKDKEEEEGSLLPKENENLENNLNSSYEKVESNENGFEKRIDQFRELTASTKIESDRNSPELFFWQVFMKCVGRAIGGILLGFGAVLGLRDLSSFCFFGNFLTNIFLFIYDQQIAGGCNIGGYFSAVNSFSLSGYIWLFMAVIGSALGAGVRKYFNLETDTSNAFFKF